MFGLFAMLLRLKIIKLLKTIIPIATTNPIYNLDFFVKVEVVVVEDADVDIGDFVARGYCGGRVILDGVKDGFISDLGKS